MNIKKEKSLKYEFDKQPIRAIAHPDITFFDSSFGRAGNLRIYGSLSSRRRKVCLFFHLYYFLPSRIGGYHRLLRRIYFNETNKNKNF
jgi:hypothetical protein